MSSAIRLDEWLCQQFDLELPIARSYLLQGFVSVNGNKVHHAGFPIRPDRDSIEFRRPPGFRNRGTAKIAPALDAVAGQGKTLEGAVCLDIGASHGGFSKALLEHGVAQIFAIDVAYGIFDFELRKRPEVTVLERHNIRNIQSSWFGSSLQKAQSIFIVCDVSFLSLRNVLENLVNFFRTELKREFQGLFLLKHQFEASDQTESGVIKDSEIRASIEEEFQSFLESLGLETLGRIPSGLSGRKGNQETFFWLRYAGPLESTASSPS